MIAKGHIMNKIHASIAVFVFLSSFAASGGQMNLINGRWWSNLDQKGKRDAYMVYTAAFMEGTREGIVFEKFRSSGQSLNREEMLNDPFFSQVQQSLQRNMVPSLGGEFDANSVVRIIDRFYSDPLNTNVSLYGALLYSANELRGTDRISLDEMLQRMRRETSR